MKIRPVGVELFHADMAKLTVAFRNFTKATKSRQVRDLRTKRKGEVKWSGFVLVHKRTEYGWVEA